MNPSPTTPLHRNERTSPVRPVVVLPATLRAPSTGGHCQELREALIRIGEERAARLAALARHVERTHGEYELIGFHLTPDRSTLTVSLPGETDSRTFVATGGFDADDIARYEITEVSSDEMSSDEVTA